VGRFVARNGFREHQAAAVGAGSPAIPAAR
jgi:hypothetical protein